MKSTTIDENGDVRCPKCGARNAFTSKRTGKAKWATGLATVVTFGAAAVVAPVVIPKRLKCNGCGTNLKRAA
jgi:DNA-directed RNA polymerase subunit RPC12/RpoP